MLVCNLTCARSCGGAGDVKAHRFFADVDFAALLAAPGPFVPNLPADCDDDTS
jgi:hypothetical protein